MHHSFPCLLNFTFYSTYFYSAMLHRARYCHAKSSVRLSACLSMTFRYVFHIGCNTSKIISRLITGSSALARADPSVGDLVRQEHPKIPRKPCCARETARCRCKIRYESKFTAASRSSPCDSAASCIM